MAAKDCGRGFDAGSFQSARLSLTSHAERSRKASRNKALSVDLALPSRSFFDEDSDDRVEHELRACSKCGKRFDAAPVNDEHEEHRTIL